MTFDLRHWIGQCAALAAVLCVSSGFGAACASERTIAFYNVHTKETLRVTYKRGGQYQPEAMKRINWILRDWRRDEPTTMDPDLIDLAWEIHRELGSRAPIHVISAFRSAKTNAMLRRSRGGQARRSQHLLGKALDMRFPDVPEWRLRYAGLIRESGGVGYYPLSKPAFVHIDTGRIRHWPRMGRSELALLFPDGRTQHRPRGGGPITRQDAVIARSRNEALAARVAAFHDARQQGLPQTIVAAVSPSLIGPFRTSVTAALRPPEPRPALRPPALVQAPRRIVRPQPSGPTTADRDALTRLAQFAAAYQPAAGAAVLRGSRVGGGQPTPWPAATADGSLRLPGVNGARRDQQFDQPGLQEMLVATWVSSPSYDDEHPDEPGNETDGAAGPEAEDQNALTDFIRSRVLEDEDEVPAEVVLPLRRDRPAARFASALTFNARPFPDLLPGANTK